MALTRKFKNLLGLIVVSAAVGGGIYYYRTMPKKSPTLDLPATQQEPVEQAPATQPAPAPAPEIQSTQAPTQMQPLPPEQAPAAQADPSTNRGLNYLLKQGSK